MARGALDEAMGSRITQELILLASDSDEDVRVLCALYGDQLDPAFAVHDVVSTIAPRVHMIGTGRIAGAGVVVFCAVPVEDRTCFPMARFHLHAFQAPLQSRAYSLSESLAADAERQRARAYTIIASATGMPLTRIEDDVQDGLMLEAREAETYGLVSRLTTRGEL